MNTVATTKPGDNERLFFLDGLRGWGAIFVLNSHLFAMIIAHGNPMFERFVEWTPFLFDGTQAVNLFFIVSGFAITYPYFSGGQKRLLLADGAIRRYPRLFIPVLGSVLLTYTLLKSNLMFVLPLAQQPDAFDWTKDQYRFVPDLFLAIRYASYDTFFNYWKVPTWNGVLWTMSYELFASLFLFFFLAAAGQWRHRLWLYVILALLLRKSIYLPFVAGVAFADCYCKTLPLPSSLSQLVARIAHIPNLGTLSFTLATGIALLGNTRLFSIRGAFGLTLIAVLLMIAAISKGPFRKFIENRFSRWLGKLSFPIYLVHWPVICSWTCWLYLGKSGEPSWAFLFAVAVSTFSFVALVATTFERFFEKPSVTISRAISRKTAARLFRQPA